MCLQLQNKAKRTKKIKTITTMYVFVQGICFCCYSNVILFCFFFLFFYALFTLHWVLASVYNDNDETLRRKKKNLHFVTIN